jgi:hypothetical protein
VNVIAAATTHTSCELRRMTTNSGSFARQNLNICLLLSDLVGVCLCIFANWIENGRDPQRL